MAEYFAVTLKRSGLGRSSSQRATLQGLGLRRLGQTVTLPDTPAVRGMLYKVVHLVALVRCQGERPASARGRYQQYIKNLS